MIIRILIVSMVVFITVLPASAQLDQILKGLGGGGKSGLSDVKIGSGLKEALQIGTENAVNITGTTDGYFMNQVIKILMPEKLKTFEKGLRAVGYGPQIDEFCGGPVHFEAVQGKDLYSECIEDLQRV